MSGPRDLFRKYGGHPDRDAIQEAARLIREVTDPLGLRTDVVASAPVAPAPERKRRRARAIPDAEAAMRRAIEALTRDHVRLTWEHVAGRMATDEPGLAGGLDAGTLRRWAAQDGLPHPGDAYWRRASA